VRFDAFDDMGGRLSFSVALLDEHGDGTVITAINGRTETRAYAKPVIRGASCHTLSQEEIAAIAQALAAKTATPQKPSRRREGGRSPQPPLPPRGDAGDAAHEREAPVGQASRWP
jgi:hypothetical protein